MIRTLAAVSWCAVAFATAAKAQTPIAPASTAASDDIGDGAVVVTATRIPTLARDVADSISLITADDIAAKQERTLPDVLRDVPGLNLVQTGGVGGQTSVFMRGTNANHVKVLVDGVDVGDPSSATGTFDFGQFLTGAIDRVEVLRGPQSGLYGSDAVGGVINVITKSANGPAQVSAQVEGGSFGAFNQTAGASGSTGPVRYAATIEHLFSAATPVTPLDLLAPGEKRNDDRYENLSASTKLGWDLGGDFDLGLAARYVNSHLRATGDDNILYGYPDPLQSRSDTLQYYMRGSAHASLFGGRFDQSLGVAYSSVRSSDTTPEAPDSYYFGDRTKIDWQGEVKLDPSETLVLGAEHQRDAISRPTTAAAAIDGGYAELQSNPIKGLHDTISVRADSNSRFGQDVTWRLAPTYFIAAAGLKVEGSVGTGFKAPTLSEMYENYPAYGFYGNPNLKAEASTGYDIGFEEQALAGRLKFGSTIYYNKIKRLIDINADYSSYANIGRAHTDGVESFIDVKPAKSVSLRLDYTYAEAEDDVLRQALLRRPKHKGTLDGRWRATKSLALGLNVVAISSFIDGNRDFSIPRLRAPGYATVDLSANYDLSNRLAVFGRISNLFDADAQDPYGFLRPPRGVFAGLKARY